jgi:hypothetical protein
MHWELEVIEMVTYFPYCWYCKKKNIVGLAVPTTRLMKKNKKRGDSL